VLADEASMIGLPDLADIIGYVTERGAKLVLAGDLQQLQPVGNGGGLSLLASRLGALPLGTPVRFANGWEGQASLRFRAGDTGVLAEYDAHGRILGGPAEDMIDHAAHRYVALTLAGTDVLLMAQDHAHRRELCRRIRQELAYLGRVAAGPTVTIADGHLASCGDMIVCTRNNHAVEAGEPGRALANGDLLRIEQIGRDGLNVRRALDADPRTGQRRWSSPFTYRDYADAELGYAVTDHAAQSRTVHTGIQLITGTETRQQAYVGISRGTHRNLLLVCTSAPREADPLPGPRPAPELARAARMEADRVGQLREVSRDRGHEALAVLTGVLSRDGAELSALQTQEQSFAAATNLAVLYSQWHAVTSAARAEQWQELLECALPEKYRGEPGPQARWLWRTLRTAELAGLDPAEVLTTAVSKRSLTGARDIAAVIDARIRRRITGMVPLPRPSWSERIPEHLEMGHQEYAAGLAAAMDRRTQHISEQAAEHPPTWAIRALGPVPADPLDRLAWQHKASAVGAYRELAGITDPAEPTGPEPVGGDPDLRAAWHDAFACLGPADGPDVRALPDGTLHLLRDGYRTQTEWAPRYVTDALRRTRIAAADAELQAIRRDALTHASHNHGDPDAAAANQKLAGSYRALAAIYRSHEMTLAATDQDRRQWEAMTDQPRRLAIAADTELRRRHPDHKLPPLQSAEPEPVTYTDVAQHPEIAQWISDLNDEHASFAKLAAAKRSEHQDVDLRQPFRSLTDARTDAILQPPPPAMTPTWKILERSRIVDREAEAAG
jgi:hypothetical protein